MNYLISRSSGKGLWQQTLGAARAGVLDLSQAPYGASQNAGNIMGSSSNGMVPYGPHSE